MKPLSGPTVLMTKCYTMYVRMYICIRVVVFVDLLSELIESATAKYNVLTDSQKVETAVYVIPEVGVT